MKALVTGGAGFIGSHIVDRYLQEGLDVVVVDDLSRGSLENVNPAARFYQMDIRDPQRLREVFERERPEVINHHAAQMDLRRGVQEPVFDAEVNILGSIHLLDCAVQYKTQRFIYASTGGAAYGEPRTVPISEDHPVDPITPYGISKHTVEHYLFTYHILYSLPYVVLRYGNVYGPRQSSKGEAGVVAIFSEQMLGGVPPKIFGDGTKTRDYVYVGDVARANALALRQGDGQILNIACGLPTTDYEIFNFVRTALGIPPFEPKYVSKRPGEIDHCYLRTEKAREILSWQPEIPLPEGIRRTVAYFQQRLSRAGGEPRNAENQQSAGGVAV
ncbi:MAG: UDP-glucose 4-epimerase [Elusimicrobia bacterium RIFCSPLOWO2_12_FULL_59_9]|nr:MAG: UDP-glucose 4-epimerase [Elusimicrobia bacterium RIFCSPLOWO2_12_FULL_59_9]